MSPPDETLQHQAQRARAWLLGRAIPFWAHAGLDGIGLAHEELGFDGRPCERGHRRAMVQFRQVYVFSVGGLLGACSPGVARDLFLRTVSLFWSREGGFVHRVAPNGAQLDPRRDAYDQAFALFASAWLHRLDPSAGALAWAERTLEHLDTCMRTPWLGYLDALPARLPWRQNPHMHLFEACLALFGATGKPAFLERAAEMATLLKSRFLNAWGGIEELFDEAFERPLRFATRTVEPGHHYEWASLLVQYGVATRDRGALTLAGRLHEFADACGTTPLGLPGAEVDATGRLRDARTKLWAVCEAIKSELALREIGTARDNGRLSLLVDALFERFLRHAAAPVWWEGIDERGEPERSRMPASTLYHVTYACAELLRYAGDAPQLQSTWSAP